MKNMVRNALVTVMGLAMVGCEWSGGGSGGGGSWSSRYNFVNFSGSYRGSPLVSKYSMTSGSSSSAAGTVNVSSESKGNVSATSFAGQCNLTPVKPGSVHLFIGGGVDGQFTDNGSGGLSGTYNVGGGVMLSASGSINYDNGAYGIVLGPAGGSAVGKPVTITYTVITGSSSVAPTSGEPGSSGVTIYAFNVEQEGNKLRIVDNNGSVYEGRFGSIRTTGGTDQDSVNASFSNGDQVMATFEANGESAAGIGVKMTGNFQATISGVSSSTSGDSTTTHMTLGGRTILGTWMEDGGATGDINGMAASVGTTTTSSSTSTNAP